MPSVLPHQLHATAWMKLKDRLSRRRLKLMRETQPIAKNALTILINISSDAEVLKLLAEDDAFLETILNRVAVCQLSSLSSRYGVKLRPRAEPQRAYSKRPLNAPRKSLQIASYRAPDQIRKCQGSRPYPIEASDRAAYRALQPRGSRRMEQKRRLRLSSLRLCGSL